MSASAFKSPRRYIDALYRGLNRGLTEVASKRYGASLYLTRIDPVLPDPSCSSFRIEGSDGYCVQGRCVVSRIGGTVYDVHVEIEDGSIRRITYRPSNGSAAPDKVAQLGRTVATIFNEIERRRRRKYLPRSASLGGGPHIPLLSLNQEGTITHLTEAARRVLEYVSDASIEPCFFAHVHRWHHQRVMRDLARMVCQDQRDTQWLLRLRTGNDQWRWYRATAQNYLNYSSVLVHVHLRPV